MVFWATEWTASATVKVAHFTQRTAYFRLIPVLEVATLGHRGLDTNIAIRLITSITITPVTYPSQKVLLMVAAPGRVGAVV